MNKKAGILPAFFYVLYNGVKVVFSPPLIYNIIYYIMEVITMKKRAFTLIEMLITVFILSFIIVFFASLVVDKTNEEISQLQENIEDYNREIEYYKEGN